MKPKKYEVIMDIYKGVLNKETIEFTTEDHGNCELIFNIVENRVEPYDLTGCIVRMVIQGTQQDCQIVSGTEGIVKISLLQSMFDYVGIIYAELQIYDASNQTLRLTTPRFRYVVRKSLMDDSTVQADPNFSILQQMIIEVSDANAVATDALNKAKEAVTTINSQVNKVNTAVETSNAASKNAHDALDRAESVVTHEELNNKIGLNSVFDSTSFNFIANEVVKDGLVYAEKNSSKKILLSDSINNKVFYFKFYNDGSSGVYEFIRASVTNRIYKEGANRIYYYIDNKMFIVSSNLSIGWHDLIVSTKDGDLYVKIDGVTRMYEAQSTELANITVCDTTLSNVYCMVYNQPLTQQEIAHNFQVLNNSPSLISMNDYAFATDSNHVTMDAGFNLEESYTGLANVLGKEFTSTGEDITINNAVPKSKTLQASVSGRTVKNLVKLESLDDVASKSISVKFLDDGYLSISARDTGSGSFFYVKKENIVVEPNKTYTLLYFVKNLTVANTNSIRVNNTPDSYFNEFYISGITKNGINKIKVTTKQDFINVTKGLSFALRYEIETGGLEFKLMILEGDWTNKELPISEPIPFGLTSTEASITLNGSNKYSFFEPTIQGTSEGLVPADNTLPTLVTGDVLDLASKTITFADKTTRVLREREMESYRSYKKIILLNKVGDVADKLEMKEDGSGVWSDNTKEKILDGLESWLVYSDGIIQDGFIRFETTLSDAVGNNNVVCIDSDMFKCVTASSIYTGTSGRGISVNSAKKLHVCIPITEASDLTNFKALLSSKKPKIIYQSSTPTTTHIPKSLCPTIPLTDKINNLEFGGAVKPSKATITAPVDRIGEYETRIANLEKALVQLALQ